MARQDIVLSHVGVKYSFWLKYLFEVAAQNFIDFNVVYSW